MSELEYLQSKVREHMNTLADHMAGGGCADFEQYQHSVGMVKAFAVVERDILDILDKIKEA